MPQEESSKRTRSKLSAKELKLKAAGFWMLMDTQPAGSCPLSNKDSYPVMAMPTPAITHRGPARPRTIPDLEHRNRRLYFCTTGLMQRGDEFDTSCEHTPKAQGQRQHDRQG